MAWFVAGLVAVFSAPASCCSSFAIRAVNTPMAAPESPPAAESDVSFTIATSRRTRGSGACRISVNAAPSCSIPRTRPAAPSRCDCSDNVATRSDDSCTRSGAMIDKNPSRRNPIISSVKVRGSRPRPTAPAAIFSARPGSRSIIASTNSSMGTVSTPSPPVLATNSSADRASRADPAP